MSTLAPESLAVINAFKNQPGVSQDQVYNLYVAVTASPALVE